MFESQKIDQFLDFDIFRVILPHFNLNLEKFNILVNNYFLKDLIMVNSIFEKNVKKF